MSIIVFQKNIGFHILTINVMRKLLIMFILVIPILAFPQMRLYESSAMLSQDIFDDAADTKETRGYYRLFLGQDIFALEYNSVFTWNSKPNFTDTTSLCLSYGSYYQDGNRLSFEDSVCGFGMSASLDELGIVQFSVAISSAKNLSLSYLKNCCSDTLSSICSIQNVMKALSDESELSCAEYESQVQFHKLGMGYYASMFNRLLLKADSSFVYYYGDKEFVYSSGKWSRIGNLLQLQDDDLEQPFFALIEDNFVLKSKFLPNAVFDGNFMYFGYNPDGPSTEDLGCPLVGDDFINASFEMKTSNNNFVNISFFHQHYAIAQTVWNGMVLRNTISFGSYRKNGCELLLNDSINGYDLCLELSPDTTSLVVKKGFVFCQDKPFLLIGKTWHSPIDGLIIPENAVDSIISFSRNQNQINPLPDGLYQLTRKGNYTYKLLLQNSIFTYAIDDVIYFQGHFSREGNLLIMEDINISEPAVALIEEDGIVPFVPGLFGSGKLKLVPW